nr:MAG TPA: hypothetical protein [Caudoviricetes sp.]DAH49574.1 MAG TPA: hypothetical protein [Caudoviricetes sp.]DAH76254.1 MAG TPA: hypothetical protein [Caudoviricetes sp.]
MLIQFAKLNLFRALTFMRDQTISSSNLDVYHFGLA